MKNVRKLVAVGAMITLVGATSLTAFAATGFTSPAEVLASLTDRTVETVVAEKIDTGKTYGTLANEAGKLTEFKAETIELKNKQLTEKVAAGVMTQERADEITTAMLANQENCDGTGTGNDGVKLGAGFGQGSGNRQGAGNCAGNGTSAGNGAGNGQGGQGGHGNMDRGTNGIGSFGQSQE